MIVLVVAVLVTLADQWTKEIIRAEFALHELRPVIDGFFELTYLRNTGAAWGMLGGHNLWLIGLSVVMLVMLVLFRKQFLSNTVSHQLAMGLLVGGIIGNLLDRVRMNYVTDFLRFHIGRYEWPSFNIADSGICIGVGIYVVSTYMSERRQSRARGAAASTDEPPAAQS